MDIGKGGLAVLQKIVNLPRWPAGTSAAGQLDLLRAEALIMDQFNAYAYAFDNQDLDTVLGFFTDDCVILTPRGHVRGVEEIRVNYRTLFGYWPCMRQLWSNVTVRFLDTDASEAYVGAYHSAVLLSDERNIAGVGTDIRRLKKVGETWKIAERWITDDVDYSISPFHGPVEDPQKVARLAQEARS